MKSLKVTAQAATSFIVAATVLLMSLHVEAAPPIQVTAAEPASAPQATVDLDVTVSGSGFDSSAAVDFFVTGTTNPGGITVKKVTVLGSKKLIARVDVADAATIAAFDIQVSLSGGRKGKGTSLFRVTAKVNDPCEVAGIDFPAFAFRRQSWEIAVADADGTCIRTVYVITAFPAGSRQDFAYPVAGTSNRGRIVWLEGNATTGRLEVVGIDFTVAGTALSVEPKRVIFPLPAGAAEGAITLGPDGRNLYANTGRGIHERVSVDNPADRTVLRDLPHDGTFFESSVNGDESAIYLTETYSEGNSGILSTELVRVDLATLQTNVLATVSGFELFWPAADPDSDRIAYASYVLGSNNCRVLQIADGTSGELYSNGQPRYGRHSTWHSGMIIGEAYSPPNRKGKCSSLDMIVEIDPASSAQRDLTRGADPDGA